MSRAIRALPLEDGPVPQQTAPKPALVPVDPKAAWPESDAGPANQLRQRLSEAYLPEPQARWSARRTLVFVVLTCGGFWLAVGLGVRALIH